MQQITKPAYNDEWRILEFKRPDGIGQLEADETIVSASILCTDGNGIDTTSAMIADITPVNSTQVRYELKGGEEGKTYALRVRCVTAIGKKLEEQFVLKIK